MFNAQQRDILRETLEWARYNDGQEVDESYDFIDDPVWTQGDWFSSAGSQCSFVSEVDALVDGRGVDSVVDGCGTTACAAGYIVLLNESVEVGPIITRRRRDI